MNFELHQEPARPQAPLAEPAFARWSPADGPMTATFHRVSGGYYVRFIDRADFAISLDEKVVTCFPVCDASEAVVRALFLNQVVPMIRSHQGELILHASVVAVGGMAVGFAARSGSGKSTLAAAFARAGMPFLSDDGLWLIDEEEHYLARPDRPNVRLWQDSEAAVILGQPLPEDCEDEKSSVAASRTLPFHDGPLPLGALYFLGGGDGEQTSISELSVRQALSWLIDHSFYLDGEDRVRLKRDFEAFAKAAEKIRCYALDYPREYDRLPEVIAAVRRHLETRKDVR